ncbi:hypothetical protein BGZ76_004204 [Entomortierella beljakovae]|nr:hypothetical protein BGZ76_004204 [Entomortierella beljakovae]
MSMTMSLAGPDNRRRTSLPHMDLGNVSGSSGYLTEEERNDFIVASSTRRPSAPNFYHTVPASSPPSTTYSSSSSGASSPRDMGNSRKNSGSNTSKNGYIGSSPILTPFQWTNDLRQYIMTDIGPQPSNSQMPSLRSQSHLVRQRSCVKISPVSHVNGGGCDHISSPGASDSAVSPTSANGTTPSSSSSSSTATYRYSTITDLCTIPQDEVLPPMEAPLERRFAHEEWDDEDE